MALGVLVWIFFPRKKFALATPQGGRLLLPPPPPLGAHLWCRLQSAFRCESCKFCKSQARPPCKKERLCPLVSSIAKSR